VDALLQNRVFWIIASALALLLCFWQGLKRWRTATLIANTPASRLRSAAQGYIEVCGIASNGAGKAGANPAPLSRRAAVWWSYTIEEPNQRGRGWHTVEHRVSEDTFLLTDEGCFCAVDPEGAAVYGAQQQVWYGEAGTPPGMGVLRLLGPVSGACRMTELCIPEQARLEIIGEFHTLGDAASADTEDDVLALLRQWKRDQPALTKRFDTNRDGVLSAQEWEAARAAARAQVRAEQSQPEAQPGLNLLSRPRDGRAFLVAADRLANVGRRARWQSALAWSGFVLSAGVLTWLLSHR